MKNLLELINNAETPSQQTQHTPATGKPLITYIQCDLSSGTARKYEITSDGVFLKDEQ